MMVGAGASFIAFLLVATKASALDLFKPAEMAAQIGKLGAIYRCERSQWPASIELLRAVEAGGVATGEPATTVPGPRRFHSSR